jgi:hypothetical protein
MRQLLIAAATTVFAASPAAALAGGPPAAQPPRPSEQVQAYAPAIDRSADALLNLDVGPILDAVDPYGAHHRRTLRDMARRNDPDFERRMHATIYGTAATMGRAADVVAAAQPAMRHALNQFEHDMAAAMAGAPPPPHARTGTPPPPQPHRDDDPWGD